MAFYPCNNNYSTVPLSNVFIYEDGHIDRDISIDTSKIILAWGKSSGSVSYNIFTPEEIINYSSTPMISVSYGNQSTKIYYKSTNLLHLTGTYSVQAIVANFDKESYHSLKFIGSCIGESYVPIDVTKNMLIYAGTQNNSSYNIFTPSQILSSSSASPLVSSTTGNQSSKVYYKGNNLLQISGRNTNFTIIAYADSFTSI